MLRSAREVLGYKLHNRDGVFGYAKDFLFDDEQWVIRYLDVDTGAYLPGRRVLVAPQNLNDPDWDSETIPTNLTAQEIEEAPGLEEDIPVSHQWESRYLSDRNSIGSDNGTDLWGLTTYPAVIKMVDMQRRAKKYNYHLQSLKEIIGYSIKAGGEEFGRVHDFILNTQTWSVQYLVIDSGTWMPGQKVLITPSYVEFFDWIEKLVGFKLSKDEILHCPKFDPAQPINREHEERLYDFYGRPRQWKRTS